MMEELRRQVDSGSLLGKTFAEGGKSYTVETADDFSYTDPIDGSVAKKQVALCIFFFIEEKTFKTLFSRKL